MTTSIELFLKKVQPIYQISIWKKFSTWIFIMIAMLLFNFNRAYPQNVKATAPGYAYDNFTSSIVTLDTVGNCFIVWNDTLTSNYSYIKNGLPYNDGIYKRAISRLGDGWLNYTVSQAYGSFMPLGFTVGTYFNSSTAGINLTGTGNLKVRIGFKFNLATLPTSGVKVLFSIRDNSNIYIDSKGLNGGTTDQYLDQFGVSVDKLGNFTPVNTYLTTSLDANDPSITYVDMDMEGGYRASYLSDGVPSTPITGFDATKVRFLELIVINGYQNILDGYKPSTLTDVKFGISPVIIGDINTALTDPSLQFKTAAQTLTGFSPQTFSLIGTRLKGKVNVSATQGFEISTNSTSGFASSLSLTPANGTLSGANLFVRIISTVSSGLLTGKVTISTSGISLKNMFLTGISSLSSQFITFGTIAGKVFGDAPFTLGATASSGLPVTYTSSNTAVATISGSNVTIIGSGTAVITASQAGATNIPAAPNVTRTLSVTKAVLTVQADNKSKALNSVNPTLTYTVTGYKNSDNVSVVSGAPVLTTTATTSSTIGIYPITIAPGTLAASNYTFNLLNGTLTIVSTGQTISFAPISAKNYGDVPFLATVSSSSGLAVTLSSSNTAVATVSGNIIVIVGAGTAIISANQAGNTGYSAAPTVTQTLTVNKAILILKGDDKSRTYNSANPSFTYSISGFKNTDNTSAISGAPNWGTTAVPTSPVGTYPIVGSLGTLAANNYSFSFINGTLTVTAASQTISFNTIPVKTYGDPSFLAAASVNSSLAVSLSSSNTSVATISGNNIVIVGAGVSNITASQSGDVNNTAAVSVVKTLTVNPAILLVQADNKNRALNTSNPTLTYSVTGFKYSDNGSALSGTPAISTTAITNSPSGTYPIQISQGTLSASNYTFSFQNGNLFLGLSTQSISFTPLSSKTYGDPVFFANATASSGLAVTLSSSNTDVVSVSGLSIGIVGAGTATITSSQNGDANFSAAQSVIQTLTVNKAMLIIKADDKYKAQGKANPSLSYTITGFKNGENAIVLSGSPLLYTAATTASSVGSYPITATTGSLSSNNYNFTFVNGNLYVTSPNQTVTLGTIGTKTFGNPDFLLTSTVSSGLSPVTYSSSNPSILSISGNSASILGAGTVTVTAYQAGDANFLPASDFEVINISKANGAITYTGATSGSISDQISLSATVNSGGTPTYTIVSGFSVASLSNNLLQLNQVGTVVIAISAVSTLNYTSASILQSIIVKEVALAITNLSTYTVVPGQTITINGTGFTSTTSVLVNSIAVIPSSINSNTIILTLPSSISGSQLSFSLANGTVTTSSTPASLVGIRQVVSVLNSNVNSTTSGLSSGGTTPVSVSLPDGINVTSIVAYYRDIPGRGSLSFSQATSNGGSFTANLPISSSTGIGLEYLFQITANGQTFNTDTIYTYRSYSDLVPFTSIQTGKTVDKYQLISFPFNFSQNTLGKVLSELGGVDATQWRMFSLSPSTSYTELNTASNVQLGTGYWLLTQKPISKLNSPADFPHVTKKNGFSKKYNKGWNILGNPYPYNLSWSDIKAVNPTKVLPDNILTYSGQYNSVNILPNYEAAFVYLSDTATITFPVAKNLSANSGRISEESEIGSKSYFNDDGWEMKVSAKSLTQRFSIGGIGVRKDASIGWDKFDIPSLPALEGMLTIGTKEYTHNVVSDTAMFTWSFQVKGQNQEPLELEWELPSQTLPLYLHDLGNGLKVDLRKQRSYQLRTNKGFEIKLGQEEELTTNWVSIGPNPVNENLSISTSLESDGILNIQLTDVSGKITGTNTFNLPVGTNSQIISVSHLSPGIYLVKVNFQSAKEQFVKTERISIQH